MTCWSPTEYVPGDHGLGHFGDVDPSVVVQRSRARSGSRSATPRRRAWTFGHEFLELRLVDLVAAHLGREGQESGHAAAAEAERDHGRRPRVSSAGGNKREQRKRGILHKDASRLEPCDGDPRRIVGRNREVVGFSRRGSRWFKGRRIGGEDGLAAAGANAGGVGGLTRAPRALRVSLHRGPAQGRASHCTPGRVNRWWRHSCGRRRSSAGVREQAARGRKSRIVLDRWAC